MKTYFYLGVFVNSVVNNITVWSCFVPDIPSLAVAGPSFEECYRRTVAGATFVLEQTDSVSNYTFPPSSLGLMTNLVEDSLTHAGISPSKNADEKTEMTVYVVLPILLPS